MRTLALSLLLAAPALAAPNASVPKLAAGGPATARVAMVTSDGPILIEVDLRHAPITASNFLHYVDEKRFDGTFFYRAARAKGAPKFGFVQGGIDHNIVRSFFPIAHEPTTRTGIRHLDATISMARDQPGSAMGDFFITIGPAPGLDAHPKDKGDNLGYAAFGHIVGGMATVKKILAAKTDPHARSAAMKGQMISDPVRIITARRAK